MTIQRPTAALRLDGSGGSLALAGGGGLNAAQAALRRLRIDLSVDEAHDRVEAWLWPGSPLAAAEIGATLAVGLGYGDSADDVLKAEVAGYDSMPGGGVLTAFAPSRRLSSTYIGRSYVDHAVGDIVGDLLSEADVVAGDVDAGIALPAFHCDPRRSAWAAMHFLARRTGHQISSTPVGAVSFTPIPGASGGGGGLMAAAASVASALGLAPAAELREGAELLDFRAGPRSGQPSQEVVTPAGGSGPTWYLPASEPDSGTGSPVLVDVALRTREAADAAGASYAAAAHRAEKSADVTVVGNPALRAGATVKARGEDYRLVRVRHILDAESGYLCDLSLEGGR